MGAAYSSLGGTQKVVVEGKSSTSAPVTSGVPQDTVLGPLLFLAYINDLPSKVHTKARLFADDCLLYCRIKTDEIAESLQDDLNKLQDWEADWQTHFNPDKCELIRITNKRKTINATYLIHNVHLKQTKRAKYLGLTFSTYCPGTRTLTPSPRGPTTPLPSCEETCQHAQGKSRTPAAEHL